MFNFTVKEENIVKTTVLFTIIIVLFSLSATVVFSILFFASIHIEAILSSVIVPAVIFPVVLYFLFRSQVKIEKLDQKLYLSTRKDLQTDTWNRRYFLELAEREFFVAKRYKDSFSVLLCDVDNFRTINETHGNLTGDKLLRTMAQTLNSAIRTTDTLARYDGKRFVILLPKIPHENAKVTALRLQKIIRENPINIPDHQIAYTISVGVVAFDESIAGVSDMMILAEKRLEEAKAAGPDSVVA